jgi:hypothetical protein
MPTANKGSRYLPKCLLMENLPTNRQGAKNAKKRKRKEKG